MANLVGQWRLGDDEPLDIGTLIARKDFPRLVQRLAESDRLMRPDSDDELLQLVRQQGTGNANDAARLFVLCADPVIGSRLLLDPVICERIQVGPCLPVDLRGPIWIVPGACETLRPLLPQLLGRKFLLVAPRQTGPELSDIARQVALTEGMASSIECPSRSMVPVALPIAHQSKDIAFELEDMPMPSSPRSGVKADTPKGPVLFREYADRLTARLDEAVPGGTGGPRQKPERETDGGNALDPPPRNRQPGGVG